jgi:metal-sulfur cluster biosynthetic enzyme
MPSTGTFSSEITEAEIYEAIADVLDPELDEPLVKLGFIDRVQVDGADVSISFKLPTYWCAPNFAYLMASDLRDRALSVPGVRTVRVALVDHCTEEEVTTAVNQGLSFSQAFPDEVPEDEQLEDLRSIFLRKGFLMRQDALLRQMLKAGLDEVTIAALRVADMTVDEPANCAFVTVQGQRVRLERVGHHATIYLRRRVSLHLPLTSDGPLIIDDEGQPLQAGGLKEFLRRSRSIRMNIMVNTTLCKGLFRTRYRRSTATDDDEEGGGL